jgi:hypothetical protein
MHRCDLGLHPGVGKADTPGMRPSWFDLGQGGGEGVSGLVLQAAVEVARTLSPGGPCGVREGETSSCPIAHGHLARASALYLTLPHALPSSLLEGATTLGMTGSGKPPQCFKIGQMVAQFGQLAALHMLWVSVLVTEGAAAAAAATAALTWMRVYDANGQRIFYDVQVGASPSSAPEAQQARVSATYVHAPLLLLLLLQSMHVLVPALRCAAL